MRIKACPSWVAKRPQNIPANQNPVARELAPSPQQRPPLLRRPCPQPPPNHIQHITPVPQRNGTEQGEVAEDDRVALDRAAHGHVFEHLRYGTNSIAGGVGQDIERRVGIDEQGGHVGAVAGERHEAAFGVGNWFFVGWIGVKIFHF